MNCIASSRERAIARGYSSASFSLIELLVVIAVIAILAALLLPVLASAKRRARLAQCVSNFHQIFIACNVYANDYNDYYPPDTTHWGAGDFNLLRGEFYTYFVLSPDQTFYGVHVLIGPGIRNGVFDNLGYLYETRGIGDGKVFWCPSFPLNSPFNPIKYSNPAFMSTDDGSMGSPRIRDTMLFNPRMMDATNGDNHRAFPKTSSIWIGSGGGGIPLFGSDYLGGGVGTYSVNTFAHYPSQGFNCLFRDGSVEFVQSVPAFEFISGGTLVVNGEDTSTAEQYNQIINWLENGQ